MSVHIIIDGYNLIRQSSVLSPLDQQDLQLGRDTLIDMLAAYKKLKRHKITVVFDGADAPGLQPRRDQAKGIAVRYSRQGESADAVIKRIAARERERALVVSSDRDITDYASGRNAAVIASPEFEARIAMAQYMAVKGEGAMSEADDGWKPTTKKKGPSRRRSKKERRNRVKLKKL